ncbi:phosphate ABC transporter permease PstA [Hahella sp. KA22]|uniref:phosphate ABC transporter permease PstA n=1 Tax=Hahella sp. KA22 TaxID=1628392 RepID=UPI000FDD0328|nr:phosphate ABC transporter permease PstA [Hahella sp. KA22]AZZ90215.1 phosphate ABC transporter permease PstA [Hahella sp. KA22]QAY53585.1 phosphate ABC transporter permease PstA [Hahella sp. KA22]
MRVSLKTWFNKGDPWIWINAGAVSISLVMVFGLLLLIGVRGLAHFWPHSLMETDYLGENDKTTLLIGEIVETEEVPAEQLHAAGVQVPSGVDYMRRDLIKTGNRDVLGSDFRWVLADRMRDVRYPKELMTLERREWGNFYGYLVSVKEDGSVVASGSGAWDELQSRIDRALSLHDRIYDIEKQQIGKVNYTLERLRLKERRLELDGRKTPEAMAEIEAERAEQHATYEVLQKDLNELYLEIKRDALVARAMNGKELEISLSKVVRAFQPNQMGLLDKIGFYFAKIWEFISDDPREANTEGGIFPAIYGTVLMVVIMSVLVTPLGVIAAVYLREYAHQGALTRIIRIAVNNLAGVPSIVYGVFGLGFFIYFIGSGIDEHFFPEALPSPTFGAPGLLWASITLAILTLPVVIVATEEGLARIPRSIREGSLALGATKAETLWRVVLPMASPAMMTGVILAIARAAGEVAPLMLVGVVKLAPSLPLDGNYPYLHLDQKFMHLGFHIYDVGFQSPNVEAARPLVYATALLLVAVIALLNLSAVAIRNRLREKYKALEM